MGKLAPIPTPRATPCSPPRYPRLVAPTRRQLLALLAAPPVLVAMGAGAAGLRWWDQPTQAGYRHLSQDEGAFLRALGGAAWPSTPACPLDGADADLDRFLDAAMDTLPETPRKAARLGLHALDALPLPLYRAPFRALDLQDRQDVLHGWLDSELMPLRTAVLSTVLLLGMGYTTHPDTAAVFSSLYKCRYGA